MKSFLIKNWVLILIVATAAILRFWHLGQNPPGLFMDEASNGYNAYSIIKTARDEYGNFLPLTFRTFGDYNPAFSVYTLVPSITLFGLSEFSVRLPSALLGTLTVLLTYFLVKKMVGEIQASKEFPLSTETVRKLPLLSAFFLTISPWHIQFSRYDHEANFMLFFSVLAVTLLVYSFKKHNLLSLSAISFALALNSYHAAKVWIPLLLLLLVIVYKKEILNFKSKLILPFIIMVISLLPIIMSFKNSLIRGQSVGILKEKSPAQTFFSNYLSHYSPNFLFVNGDNIGRHSVSGMGELYVFEIPLIAIGLVTLVTLRGKPKKFILGWLLLAAVPASLANPTPHALRSLMFTPVWSIVSALGLARLMSLKINELQKTLLISAIAFLGLYNFLTYLHLYYKHYPKLRARDWQDGYKQMIRYIEPIKNDYKSIAITNYFARPYIFVLFYTKYDPQIYQSQSQNKEAFDIYEFFGSSWEKTKPGKALVVTPPWQAHPPKVLKEIYAENGDLTFTISETE